MATNVFHKAPICQSCKCAAIPTMSKRNNSSLFMKVSSKMSRVKSDQDFNTVFDNFPWPETPNSRVFQTQIMHFFKHFSRCIICTCNSFAIL